jgi:hypothetical protein
MANLVLLATMRIAVGLLGEKARASWWSSAFFSDASGMFITPLFPRTFLLAQAHGVTAAAMRIHDERIGIGQAFHLFRLPEDLESGVHHCLVNSFASVWDHVNDADSAQAFLDRFEHVSSEPGPSLVGGLASIRSQESWESVGARYAAGFRQREAVCPYFADRR